MPSPRTIVCEDPPEIRVPDKEDAIEVVNLPLIPVRGPVHCRRARHRCDFIRVRLDPNARIVPDAKKVVDDLEALASCWVVGA